MSWNNWTPYSRLTILGMFEESLDHLLLTQDDLNNINIDK